MRLIALVERAVRQLIALLLVIGCQNLLFEPQAWANAADAPAKPNILVILADDLGYADVGFQGCQDIATPHLDRLAGSGVRCTSGYVTHPFCSPTRAGLLTGRYQQRFGHENNPAWLPEDPNVGLPVSQVTMADVLRQADYATGCVGKWHLGAHPVFHPNRRGFDEYFGLLGGGHAYFAGAKGGAEYQIPLDRNGKAEPLEGYLTEVLGREASAYIERHRQHPWFLYLAFNAPHTPLQATEAQLQRVKHIADETRRGYAALVVGLDDAVGQLLNTLRTTGQDRNTLVFFFSDNGGPFKVTHSSNAPLRGGKGEVLEGGIRVPFVVAWPDKLAAGSQYNGPVSSLDVFATAVAVTGAKVPQSHQLDGVNILPQLSGTGSAGERSTMFWRTGGGAAFSAREGRYKLVRIGDGKDELYDLDSDIGESSDVGAKQPEIAQRLRASIDTWNAELVPPLFENPKRRSGPREAAKVDVTVQP